MGKVILCTGFEENIGKTTISLSLGKSISDILKKPVLAVDLDTISPSYFNILSGEDGYSFKNIDIVMTYALDKDDLPDVIKGNKETLTNSNLDVLFGSNTDDEEIFTERQYANFIEIIKGLYDVSIIDWNADFIPNIIADKVDMILIIGNQNKNRIRKVRQNKKIFENGKSIVLINKFEENTMTLEQIGKELNQKIELKVRYDKAIIKKMNNGDLNMNDTKFGDDIDLVSRNMLNKLGVDFPKKKSLLNIKFLNNKKNEGDDIVKLTR